MVVLELDFQSPAAGSSDDGLRLPVIFTIRLRFSGLGCDQGIKPHFFSMNGAKRIGCLGLKLLKTSVSETPQVQKCIGFAHCWTSPQKVPRLSYRVTVIAYFRKSTANGVVSDLMRAHLPRISGVGGAIGHHSGLSPGANGTTALALRQAHSLKRPNLCCPSGQQLRQLRQKRSSHTLAYSSAILHASLDHRLPPAEL